MVTETVQMLVTQITEGTGISNRVVLDAALIIRSSTRKHGDS